MRKTHSSRWNPYQLALRGLMLVLVGAWSGLVPAQSLDEIERQIEAAKREQAAKAAAEKREAEARAAREAAARREREQAAAAEARMGTLVVRSDHACRLGIDGTYRQDIGPGQTASLKVEPGDQLIECVSASFPTLKVEEIKAVPAGSKSVVVLSFGDRASEAEAAERAARQKLESEARQQRERVETVARRLKQREQALAQRFQQSAEEVHDAEQGIVWTSADNGSDINWQDAKSYCASKGASWSLPTAVQLQSLKWRVGPMQYTGWWYWSADTSGSSVAYLVYLIAGDRHPAPVSLSSYRRALCVRRP